MNIMTKLTFAFILSCPIIASAGDRPAGPLATLVLHVRGLLAEINPQLDAETLAHMLLGALAAAAFEANMREEGADVPALQRAGAVLLSGVLPPRSSARKSAQRRAP